MNQPALMTYTLLKTRFNLEEIRTLLFRLGKSGEVSDMRNLSAAAHETVGYYERRGRLDKLVDAIAGERPDLHSECNAILLLLGQELKEAPVAETPMTPDESDLYALVDRLERELNAARKTVLEIKARL